MSEFHTGPQPACWDWPLDPPTEPGDRWERREQVIRWQDGRCAICASPEPRMVEDHDHYTGMSRGWLCSSCNALEGRSSALIIRCYRNNNPASLWLWKWEYSDPWSAGINADSFHALTSGKLSKEQIQAGARLPDDIWATARAIDLGL